MRMALGYLLLLGVSLNAQSSGEDKAADKLNSILMAMKGSRASQTSLAQQLRNEMMALAGANRKPSRTTVSGFADEFTDALFGKNLTNAQVSVLESSITDLLRGSTANFNSASRLREILVVLHVADAKTQKITR